MNSGWGEMRATRATRRTAGASVAASVSAAAEPEAEARGDAAGEVREKDAAGVLGELRKGHPRVSAVRGLDAVAVGFLLLAAAVVGAWPVGYLLTRVERSAMPSARIHAAAGAPAPRLPVALTVAVVGGAGEGAGVSGGVRVAEAEARIASRLGARLDACVEGNARLDNVRVVSSEDASGALGACWGAAASGEDAAVAECEAAGAAWVEAMGAAESDDGAWAVGPGRFHLLLLLGGSGSAGEGSGGGVFLRVGSGRHGWAVAPLGLSATGAEWVGAWVEAAAELYLCSVADCGADGATGLGAGLPLSSTYTATMSLLNPEPLVYAYDWEIEDATARWLDPLAARLGGALADFEFQSQRVHYAAMGATPSRVGGRDVGEGEGEGEGESPYRPWVVAHAELRYFVDQSLWGLDTSSRLATPLHFAVYVPGASHCPLLLNETFDARDEAVADPRTHLGGAFTVPGWGGVIVLNPPREVCEWAGEGRPAFPKLGLSELHAVASTAVAQLRELMGLAGVPGDIHADLVGSPLGARWPEATVGFSVAAKDGVADWEVDLLARRRTGQYLDSARNSMVALDNVVRRLENLEVLGEIQGVVAEALALLEDANAPRGWDVSPEGSGDVYEAAVGRARRAYDACEAAFYHPAVSSLDYHDTDHTVAIYMPFFLPVVLIFLQFTRREAKYILAALRGTAPGSTKEGNPPGKVKPE